MTPGDIDIEGCNSYRLEVRCRTRRPPDEGMVYGHGGDVRNRTQSLSQYEDGWIGIPVSRTAIFNPHHGNNSGYGLFLVKVIFSVSGITIQETGEPGKGARFELHVRRMHTGSRITQKERMRYNRLRCTSFS